MSLHPLAILAITYARCMERVPCVNPAGPCVLWALAGYFPLPQTDGPGTLLLGQLQDYEAIFPLLSDSAKDKSSTWPDMM